MRTGWLLAFLAASAWGAELRIYPSLVTQCVNGAGQVELEWQDAGPGPVQIRLFRATGPPMTGWEEPSGRARTDPWVTDQLVFVLVSAAGEELARAVARVRCNAIIDPPGNASYWPLGVGNRWVYRSDSRVQTAAYQHWQVTGTRFAGSHIYSVLDRPGQEWLLREDDQGRIWRYLDSPPPGGEVLWLDPVTPPSPDARLRIESRGAFSGPLGDFSDAVSYRTSNGLLFEDGQFVRGLGLARSSTTLLTGSSGGFTDGLQLIEAQVNGRTWALEKTEVSLAVADRHLDVTGRQVDNCAVPCYFVACGLTPGTDPPNTWKPCTPVRVRTEHAPSDTTALLELVNSQGTTVQQQNLPVGRYGTVHSQLPLYSKPNDPFAAGAYQLRVELRDPAGLSRGSASLPLTIE